VGHFFTWFITAVLSAIGFVGFLLSSTSGPQASSKVILHFRHNAGFSTLMTMAIRLSIAQKRHFFVTNSKLQSTSLSPSETY
jgi:hypothetical protein